MMPSEILHRHNLKRTSCREGILFTIQQAEQPLSEQEIRDKLAGKFDRTTFYRSFKTLIEYKIVHKIVVNNTITRYALDNSITHKNLHAHFYCEQCENVECMDNVPVAIPDLPIGYTAHETELIIKGLCNHCKHDDQQK